MRIVITGGSGLLALNWAYSMRHQAEICLFTHRHDVCMEHVVSRRVELTDQNILINALDDWGPDLVVHTAGMTNVDGCERNAEQAYMANAQIARNVAKVAFDLGLRLVHISTDHLFNGKKPLVSEQEAPFPLNIYGKTKLKGEQQVTAIHPGALIVRTNFFGWGPPGRVSFTDWIINTLRKGQSIPAFYDAFFSPILIDYLVSVAHQLLDRQVSGIIHVTGDQRMSKYEFALLVAQIFGLDDSLVRRASLKKANLPAKRPLDMSLSNRRAVELLDRPIGNVESGLRDLLKQLKQGRPKGLSHTIL